MKKKTKSGIDWSKKDIHEGIGRPDLKPKKDCLFQYATKHNILVDTELITREKADELLEKNLKDIKGRWNELESPQMGIWINCKTNTSYHTLAVDIDFRDCKLEGDNFYRVKDELII